MASLTNVLPYIDIPVQHISHRILERMGRFTPPDRIYDLINRVRERIEGVVLRTAVMVGFPGETDEDFRELLDFIERVRFERLGAFVYSPEEGTRAALLEDKVPEETAQERFEIIMGTQARISAEFHRTLIGSELEMIIDSVDPENGTIAGRTYMDAPDIDGNITAVGSVEEDKAFCCVRVSEAKTYDLIADIK